MFLTKKVTVMKFWKVFLAALLAVLASGLILWGGAMFLIGIFAGASAGNQPTITSDTIVKIDLAESITDAPSKNPLAGFDYTTMTMESSTTLLKVLQGIEAAAKDERVKGLYLNFTGSGMLSTGNMEELRNAIASFKESGKFVVAYNENYTQGGYYLASVADKIYLHPEGGFSWAGLAQTNIFFKGALDKLGLGVEVFRPTVCKYKGAVEPYIRKDYSPENRAQSQMLIDDVWKVMVEEIAASRSLDPATLNKLADNLEVNFPEEALKHGFVNALVYEHEMDEVFASLGVKTKEDNTYNIISLGEYTTLNPVVALPISPAVGIVYAEGNVLDGEGTDDNVYSANVSATLRKARENDNIKAVVFRVNSPGGSALASDVIWKEVELLRAKKPVIVSMGGYAASGGYYISAPADVIIADKLTLTGSIGVFGMMMEGGDLLEEKLGVTTDVVKTNKSADMMQGVYGIRTRKFTDHERKLMLRSVDKVYEAFTGRVAAGRNLPMEKVLDIAQGRVWSGVRAVELGLVDSNGGLREAIALAASKADISDNFRVEEVLEDMDPMMMLMQQLNSGAISILLDKDSREAISFYKEIKGAMLREGVQAYCPYTLNID